MWSGAVSGPRLRASMRMQMSSGRALRVRELDVEVSGLLEHAGVDELVLVLLTASVPVALDEVAVGERALRVLVQPAHVRVGRRRVERPPVLLDVLAVVALGVGEAEEALLQDRVVRVPQRDGEAQVLPVVADAAQAVLAPAVCPRARVLVGERVPGGATRAVVLAHRAPLARRRGTDPTVSTAPPGCDPRRVGLVRRRCSWVRAVYGGASHPAGARR